MTLAYESRTGSGRRKAAIALVALGAERAATLLRDLSEGEVRELAEEVAALGPVAPDEVRATLRELQVGLTDVQQLPPPGARFARDLLVRALGQERGDRLATEVEAPGLFSWLAVADANQAAQALTVEPPGVVALALAHLPARSAARVLTRLPEAMRTEVATRIANLSTVHPDTIAEVDGALRARVEGVLAAEVVPVAGPDVLAEILAFSGRDAEKQVLAELSKTAADLADQVRAALFTFDDIAKLEAKALQTLLKGVDTRQLAVALKNADEQVLAKILSNLSERAREGLLEEIDLLTSVRASDIDVARKAIVQTAKQLEEEGSLVITRPDEDDSA
jgi:flagellar motor switch protein FliG